MGRGTRLWVKRIRVGPSTRHDYLSAEGVVSRHTLSATLRLAHFELCQAIGTFLLLCVYLGATRWKPPYVIRQHYWQQLKQRHSELSTPLQIYCFGERLIVCCVGIANIQKTTEYDALLLVRVFCGKDTGEPEESPLCPISQDAYISAPTLSYSRRRRRKRITEGREGRRGINKAS